MSTRTTATARTTGGLSGRPIATASSIRGEAVKKQRETVTLPKGSSRQGPDGRCATWTFFCWDDSGVGHEFFLREWTAEEEDLAQNAGGMAEADLGLRKPSYF